MSGPDAGGRGGARPLSPPLLPCPFCGAPAEIERNTEGSFDAWCSRPECWAVLQRFGDVGRAVAAWNRRVAVSATTPGVDPVHGVREEHAPRGNPTDLSAAELIDALGDEGEVSR